MWAQFTSLTYFLGVILAATTAQSSLNLGFLGAAFALPALCVAPIGGFLADRYPRRRTIMIAAVIRVILALAFSIVSMQHASWVPGVTLAITGLFAAAFTLDLPSRDTWVPALVPRRLIGNGIGLYAMASNAPLTIGPAVAGYLIGSAGLQAAFLINAVAQCISLVTVFWMRPVAATNPSREPMLRQIVDGVRFVASHPTLRWIVVLLLLVNLCVRPYVWLLAAFAGHILFVDAKAYGLMLAAGGVGSVVGALGSALWPYQRRSPLWIAAASSVSAGVLLLSFVRDFWTALAIVAFCGVGLMALASSTNIFLQILSSDEMRGRAISLQSVIGQGIVPLGTLMMGALASAIGLPAVFALGGIIGLLSGAWIWFANPEVRRV